MESIWEGPVKLMGNRFSDFQVNEIGLDGKVIHLQTAGLTEEQKKAEGVTENEEPVEKPKEGTKPIEEEKEQESQKPVNIIEVAPEDVKILSDLTGEKFAHDLVELYREAQMADPEQRIKPIASDTIEDKYTRGQIHQQVRRIFQSRLETNTNGDGGIVATAIRERPRGKKRNHGGREQRDTRQRNNTRPPAEYLHFTLYKDNRDTMDAVTQISRMIRAKPQAIGYAGTKDRRASTTQRCSIRYTHQRSLAGLNGKLWGISTGDYEYRDEAVFLGQLLGNEFVITLKDCKVAEQAGIEPKPISEQLGLLKANVGTALEHMAKHGWINYFGHQRFGTHQIGTHEVGKLILSDKYEEAVNALLSYDPETASKYSSEEQEPGAKSNLEEVARHYACMLFRTGRDVSKAAGIMPRRFAAEVCVMRHLTRGGASSMKDYVGSLTHITRGLRSMYLHAYQSHIWNHTASMRWEKYGAKVIKGDLIIDDSEAVPLFGGKDQDGDEIINPVDDDDNTPVRARPITEEEAASGRYTIHDIVLPTPGYQVIYPENDVGDFYTEFMGREENGGLDPRKMMRMRREFSLPGRYRKVMNRFLAAPSIEFRTYTDEKEQMHPTDMDVINAAKGEEPAPKKAKADDEQPSEALAEVPAEKIAAIVRFQLGRSAYATVTLRELMGDMQEE